MVSRAHGEMYLATPVFNTVRKVGDILKVPVVCSKSLRERGSGSSPLLAALGDTNALHDPSVDLSIFCGGSYTIQTSHAAYRLNGH